MWKCTTALCKLRVLRVKRRKLRVMRKTDRKRRFTRKKSTLRVYVFYAYPTSNFFEFAILLKFLINCMYKKLMISSKLRFSSCTDFFELHRFLRATLICQLLLLSSQANEFLGLSLVPLTCLPTLASILLYCRLCWLYACSMAYLFVSIITIYCNNI